MAKRIAKLPINKSKRQKFSEANFVHSENLFWPETDASFFSNAKLEDLLSDPAFSSQNSSGTKSNSEDLLFTGVIESPSLDVTTIKNLPTQTNHVRNKFNESDSDDGLFCNLTLPKNVQHSKDSTTTTTATSNYESELKNDDTLFAEIDLDDLTKRQVEDIFPNEPERNEVQNTQRFFDDIAFKMPKTPARTNNGKVKLKNESMLSKSIIEGIIQGSQYETASEIRSVLHNTQNAIEKEIASLEHLDWETQVFEKPDYFPSKGNFYGLPERVKNLIFEHKGIKNLYDWQDECLNLPAIRKRKNLIYALPTSGGKTLVAEILILRELLCYERNVLFILPYVSIVQEKVSAMSPFAIALDFLVDEYTAGKGKCPPVARLKRKSLFVASIEKGAVLMDSLIDVHRAHEIGLVVVDELHLIGERGRGATLEAFLTKVMFLNANIQIVGMSATIGNITEISAFLNADVYTRGFRPVELKEYIKCGPDLLEINSAGQTMEDVFVFKRSTNFNYSAAVARADPDQLAGLVTECAPTSCCLIFCPTRKNCENVAMLLSRTLPKHKFLEHRKSEKGDLMAALDKICGILSPVLAKTLPYGIAYHHSGLTSDERRYIETAYRFGVISVICCTSTLAAGVNLPAKRVIIRAPYVGQEFMTLCKYKQMVGRAGRAGLGEAGESILISQSADNLRIAEMLFSPMDKALSSLDQQDSVGLQGLVLSAIGLNLTVCRRDINRLVNSTLLAVQATQLGVDLNELVLSIVREMFKNKVLQLSPQVVDTSAPDSSTIAITQDLAHSSSNRNISQVGGKNRRLMIGRSTHFQLTSIGKAAFKAGIDYKRAYAIQKELQLAQQHLILSNYAHLLYLVVTFNSNERGDDLIAADAAILFRCYTALPSNTQALFKLLGFTEAHAARLATTQSVHGPLALQLNRLYKVLILLDILDLIPLPSVASKFNVERGTLQQLISQSTSAASAIVRLCDQLDDFWCYKPLFERINAKMDRCGSLELEALLELPSVKMIRAKQLYAAGYRTLEDIAKTRPMTLVKTIEHMPLKIATEIISAAKIILMKKLDHLEVETEALKTCLRSEVNSEQTPNIK